MQILIVDDDPIDVALIKRELDKSLLCDYSVQVASSVNEGLRKVESEKIDLVLLDYQMPEVDGIEMIIEIRSKPKLGNTAIVVVSSSLDESVALNSIEAGAQDFIPKSEITQIKLYQAIIHSRKRFEMEQEMHESYLAVKNLAEKDQLTGLHNRYYFDENLKSMLADSHRSNCAVGMLSLDLDNFKHINDTMGHEAGDILLKEVVGRVKGCLRINDGFSRLGGDEFAITLNKIRSNDEMSHIANRIIDSFKSQFIIDGKKVNCSVSIGAALYPNDAADSHELVKCADVAMYRAKQSGKNAICFYESHYQNEFNRRFLIQNKMSEILSQSSFRLFYQPVFCSLSNKIIGLEALIRWPETKISYTPDVFIPIAEESRQINEIGSWVLDTAIRQLSEWQNQYANDLTMSINISPVQLQRSGLYEEIASITNKYAIDPNSITLEITETALLENDDVTTKTLFSLSSDGFQIALDDFGMGYSSISHLINFLFDIVKLDKSMQPVSGDDEKKKAIFEAVTMMLERLNITMVAEGVETESQLALCKELKINRLQGYLLSRPLPPELIEQQLQSNFKNSS